MSQYFSQAGLDKLKAELDERNGKQRPEIAKKIHEAKELGDLSENAEYIEAKEMQAFNEGRIEELEDILKNAVVMGPHQQSEVILIGSTVVAKGLPSPSSDKRPELNEKKFTIVGASESSPAQGFISNESPLGSAFLNHKKGDEVEVLTPSGIVKYKILEVS